MNKLIVFIFLFFVFLSSKGQGIVQRGASTVTVSDSRLQANLNLFIPRYLDTVQANTLRGIDSSGAIIYTYDYGLWYRAHNPKRWLAVLPTLSPTGDTAFWRIGGNNFNTLPIIPSLGTTSNHPLYFQTNSLKRAGIPADGFSNLVSVQSKYLGVDTTTGFIGYLSGGSGGSLRFGVEDSVASQSRTFKTTPANQFIIKNVDGTSDSTMLITDTEGSSMDILNRSSLGQSYVSVEVGSLQVGTDSAYLNFNASNGAVFFDGKTQKTGIKYNSLDTSNYVDGTLITKDYLSKRLQGVANLDSPIVAGFGLIKNIASNIINLKVDTSVITTPYDLSEGLATKQNIIIIDNIDAQPKNNKGVSLTGANLSLQSASQRYNGILKTADKLRIDKGGISPIKYTNVSSGQYYDGFPYATSIKDTIYIAFSRKTCHVCVGWIPLFKSLDGGLTYDSSSVLATIGNNVVLSSDNDTLYYSYEDAPLSNYQYFGYSADFGKTFIKTDSIDHPTLGTVAFDKVLRLPSGKRILPYYGYGSSWEIGLFESDDGINWDLGTVIASGSNGAVELNEISIENITPYATTDADVKLIAVVRNEGVTGEHYQYRSADGGSSWTFTGRLGKLFSSGDELYGYPIYIFMHGGKIGAIAGKRTDEAGGSTAYDMHTAVVWGNPNEVFTDTSKWSNANRIYNAEANYSAKGFPNDYGYNYPFHLNGTLLNVGYDVAPQNSPLDSTYTRIYVSPIINDPYCEYFSKSNQSISANTETKVFIDNIWLDTDAFSNTSDSSFIIDRDGWYNITASACYQSSYSGTTRKLYLKVINPGLSSANRTVQVKSVQATENIDYLLMDINATEYLRAGERIALYTWTDGTGDALRNQNEIYNRAKIKIVKMQ